MNSRPERAVQDRRRIRNPLRGAGARRRSASIGAPRPARDASGSRSARRDQRAITCGTVAADRRRALCARPDARDGRAVDRGESDEATGTPACSGAQSADQNGEQLGAGLCEGRPERATVGLPGRRCPDGGVDRGRSAAAPARCLARARLPARPYGGRRCGRRRSRRRRASPPPEPARPASAFRCRRFRRAYSLTPTAASIASGFRNGRTSAAVSFPAPRPRRRNRRRVRRLAQRRRRSRQAGLPCGNCTGPGRQREGWPQRAGWLASGRPRRCG